MRRSVPSLSFYPVLVILVLLWSACGDDGGSRDTSVAKIVLNPTTVSLNRGATGSITATAQDSGGSTVSTDFTFSSSDSDLVSVSNFGQLCAGKWDKDFVVCTASTKPAGFATITVGAKNNGVTSTAKVYVHERIDFVQVSGPATCISSAGTHQLSAKAFSRDAAVCGGATPCELPADTVGQFTYLSRDTDIVSIDNATNIGKATAGIPGRTFVYATVSNVNSTTVPFETCPVTSIDVSIKDSTATSFTVEKNGTASLVAVVKDSKGTTLTTPPISWITSQQFIATVAQGSPALTATATGVTPGNAFVQAACTPPACNRCSALACTNDTVAVYSKAIQGKVNGTAVGTVYAASMDSTQLVPIEVATNAPGTAITLTRTPNSMIVNSTGTRIVLGSATAAAMLVDPATNGVTEASINATALAFTRNGAIGILVDPATDRTYTYDVSNGTLGGGYVISPELTQFDSAPTNNITDAVNGTSKLYGLSANNFVSSDAGAAVNDLAVLQTGQAIYLTAPSTDSVIVQSACDGSVLDTRSATNPQGIEALPNGDGAVVVDATGLVILNNVQFSGVCPGLLTETRNAVTLPISGYQLRQLLVTPDSSKAIISTDKGLVVVNLNTLTATQVTLGGGATQTYSGGVTTDSKNFYIGANDGTVHRVDLTVSPAVDAQQIAVNLKKSDNSAAMPQLVVVRNKS